MRCWVKQWCMLLTLLCLCGCAAALVGAGAGAGIAGYKFIEGELRVDYIGVSYQKVRRAVHQALKDANIPIKKEEYDAINTKIKAKKADGRSVILKIENNPSGIVRVSIRVGVFGDQDASLIIKKLIDKRLGLKNK